MTPDLADREYLEQAIIAAGSIGAQEFARLVRVHNPKSNSARIIEAFAFGANAHRHQVRKTGQPYFVHPIAVARRLIEMRLDDTTIITALLHDVVEDTERPLAEVHERFGPDVAALVDGVTKLGQIRIQGGEERDQLLNFRKMMLAVSRDIRVILIKLADRLHNMQTINGHELKEKRQKVAQETIDLYAPLAARMGMQQIREELEDLCFKVLHPSARYAILRRFVQLRREHGDVVPKIEEELQTLFEGRMEVEIHGRQKRPYSIFRKMKEQQVTFERLSDVVGFRIIVENAAACYRALGIVHTEWHGMPDRLKDYISSPKSNGYRSIHTTVIGPERQRIEIQVRSRAMHEIAETGVAAHWSYRDGEPTNNRYAFDPSAWLTELAGRMEAGSDDDLSDFVKLDIHADQVFCYTPRGKVIPLPRGATVLDFAYAVHTDVGQSCVGAMVDGYQQPLWAELQNGQEVEILRSSGQHAQEGMEIYAKTGRARAAIRRSLREQARKEYAELGERVLERTFERAGLHLTRTSLRVASRELGIESVDELCVQVGHSELDPYRVLGVIDPNAAAIESARNTDELPEKPITHKDGSGVARALSYARCCSPIPGDNIVGLRHKGGGAIIHSLECDQVAMDEDNAEDWLDITWSHGADEAATHQTGVVLSVTNQPGALGEICTVIGAAGANIVNLTLPKRVPHLYRTEIVVQVRDLRHLLRILVALRARQSVVSAERLYDIRAWTAESESAETDTSSGPHDPK